INHGRRYGLVSSPSLCLVFNSLLWCGHLDDGRVYVFVAFEFLTFCLMVVKRQPNFLGLVNYYICAYGINNLSAFSVVERFLEVCVLFLSFPFIPKFLYFEIGHFQIRDCSDS
ncbi:hypothetical protein V8G54_010219, partial [Vigna mungo]